MISILITDNIQTPLIFIPLDDPLLTYADIKVVTQPASTVPQLDKYGYPLNVAYFNSTNKATLESTTSVDISENFTLCFHLKQSKLMGSTLFTLDADKFTVSLLNSGEISLK